MTNARSRDMLTFAESQARRTALCTVFTGSPVSQGSTVTSAIISPVMSATPAVTLPGSTSRPAT